MKPDETKSPLPWQGLLTLAVAITGTIFYLTPLETSRPVANTGASYQVDRAQNVNARLWQDPLAAVYAHQADLEAIEEKTHQNELAHETGLHSLDRLKQDINDAKSADGKHRLRVLPVMIPSGAYSEYAETRLRMRRAVMEGLATNGFAPQDGEHVGYARFQRPDEPRASPAPPPAAEGAAAATAPFVLLPYEWCEPMFEGESQNANTKILVLWLPDEQFQDTPLTSLVALLDTLGIKAAASPVNVIGPRGSAALRAIVKEALDPTLTRALNGTPDPAAGERPAPLAGLTLFSASPTASEEMLLYGTGASDWQSPPGKRNVKELLKEKLPALRFYRTTSTDEDVCEALVQELRRRGVNPGPDADHVALISEWDTFYGRALPLTFAEAASRWPLKDLRAKYPDNIHPFQYLRGIDGMLPGSSAKELSPKNEDKDKKVSRPREAAEGLDQADYLRRLAGRLQELNQRLLYKEGRGLGAVGVLGSDVYDKLLVLKSLRRSLPGVLFFTNSLDARLGHPEEWEWARNLIVASPFGLELTESIHLSYQSNRIALQAKSPPFRDSYQTAVYLAATLATDESKARLLDLHGSLLAVPQIFEIARSGPYELDSEADQQRSLHPAPKSKWWNGKRLLRAFMIGCLLGAMFVWVKSVLVGKPRQTPVLRSRAARIERPKAGAGTESAAVPLFAPSIRTEKISLLSPGTVFVLAAMFAWTTIRLIVSFQPTGGVPFLWQEGISLWPTETIRLIVIVMASFFAWKTYSVLKENLHDIEQEFALDPPTVRRDPPVAWLTRKGWEERIRRLTLLYWPVQSSESLKIDAQVLWNEYVWSGSLSRRILRVAPLLACYLLAVTFFMLLLGFPAVPHRGLYSLVWDHCFLTGAIIASTALTFYVADATILNRRLIHYITVDDTDWPKNTYLKLRESRKLALKSDRVTPQDHLLCDFLEIELIARRTEVVSNLIYYPFAVLGLMIVSRSNLFANWDWPLPLILVLLVNGGYAVWTALSLRNSAEKARRLTLQRLNNLLLAYTAAGEGLGSEAGTIREMVATIEDEDRGAFADLAHHPILGAVLLPSGGLGIWALSQYVPRFFE